MQTQNPLRGGQLVRRLVAGSVGFAHCQIPRCESVACWGQKINAKMEVLRKYRNVEQISSAVSLNDTFHDNWHKSRAFNP